MYHVGMPKRLLTLAAAIALLGASCSSPPATGYLPPPAEQPPLVAPAREQNLIVEERTASSSRFLVIRQKEPQVKLALIRPDENDPDILLSVPGTYTSPQDTIEGYVVLDGQIVQQKERQGWDGAIAFKDGGVDIRQTNRGRALTKEALADIAAQGASLIQVHLLVKDGTPQHFKEQPPTLRRALAVMKDGTPAVIESRDFFDLNAFAALLVELGARDAANLDMGSWSAGWYRGGDGRPVPIGYPHENAKRQTNWIVFGE
ncbi:hypothetical protein EPO33_04955 [Patescibacteria group bacterium]|nr:MAG: hypothetical protein EPO33_04955 [Patescibacteria group bacterium]